MPAPVPAITPDQYNEPITDADVGRAAEALNNTEDFWAKVASMSTPTIVCPSCGGAGTMVAGSFGEIPCDMCDGSKEVEHPLAEELGKLELPDFAGPRKLLLEMGQALDQRNRTIYENTVALENGEKDKIKPVPAAPQKGQLAKIEVQIAGLREHCRQKALEIEAPKRRRNELGAAAAATRALPGAMSEGGGGSLGGEYSDDDDQVLG